MVFKRKTSPGAVPADPSSFTDSWHCSTTAQRRSGHTRLMSCVPGTVTTLIPPMWPSSWSLHFVSTKRSESAPRYSVALEVTTKERIHPRARAVAEAHVRLVRPAAVLEVVDRLVRAWRTARMRNPGSLTSSDAISIFSAERVFPSQWLPTLRTPPHRPPTTGHRPAASDPWSLRPVRDCARKGWPLTGQLWTRAHHTRPAFRAR